MSETNERKIPFTPPMECLPVANLPEGPDWVYELKLDGFRGQAIRDRDGVHLLSKNGKDFSKKFPQVFAALGKALPMGTAVDGELVAFDEDGRTSFNAIQNASAETLADECELKPNGKKLKSNIGAARKGNTAKKVSKEEQRLNRLWDLYHKVPNRYAFDFDNFTLWITEDEEGRAWVQKHATDEVDPVMPKPTYEPVNNPTAPGVFYRHASGIVWCSKCTVDSQEDRSLSTVEGQNRHYMVNHLIEGDDDELV
jgi:hypothetical protein